MQTLQLAKQLCLNLRDTEIKFSKTFNILQLNRLLVNKTIHTNQALTCPRKQNLIFFSALNSFYFSLFNFNVNSNSIIKISNRYQLCLQIWILMSFQETLVSKKQKKTKKKYSKCTKTKNCKKNKDCYLQHLYHCHNNKTRLKFITRIF